MDPEKAEYQSVAMEEDISPRSGASTGFSPVSLVGEKASEKGPAEERLKWVNREARCQTELKVVEKPKVAFQPAGWKRVKQCMIHFIPSVTTIGFLIMHTRPRGGHWIGGELEGPMQGELGNTLKLNALQFAAKAHELFIMASISHVIVDLVRHQLVFGAGIPFGSLLSSTLFGDPTFLWSSELWGSVGSSRKHLGWRMFGILIFIIVCTFGAPLVGPSTAVILLPEDIPDWPGGGTSFRMPGSLTTLYPTNLTVDIVPKKMDIDCLSGKAVTEPLCPSGGFFSLYEYVSALKRRDDTPPDLVPVTNALSGRVRSLESTGRLLGLYATDETLARVPPYQLSESLSFVAREWARAMTQKDVLHLKYFRRRDVKYSVPSMAPVARTRCLDVIDVEVTDEMVSEDKQLKLTFPSMRVSKVDAEHETPPKIQLVDVSASKLQALFKGIHTLTHVFPESFTGAGSIGWILYHGDPGSFTRKVMTCTVDARWAPANIVLDDLPGLIGVELLLTKNETTQIADRASFGSEDETWQRVKATNGWAKYLMPQVQMPGTNGSSQALEILIDRAGVQNFEDKTDPPVIERILSLIVAEGMSRIGLTRSEFKDWNIQRKGWAQEMAAGGNAYDYPVVSGTTPPYIDLHMEVYMEGYGYPALNTKPWARILSFLALLTPLFMAAAHTLWVVTSTYTSSTWANPSDIVALALNSQPSEVLKNTSAGIKSRKTLGRILRVVDEGDRLEMAFMSERGGNRPQAGKRYG